MSTPTPTNAVSSSTNLFRRLTFQSSIPLEIALAEGEPGHGSGCDRYYTHAPRCTYLPLLIPEIREHLVELALDDQQLANTDESQWWFEEAPTGNGQLAGQGPCKWHWPLDLIHLHSLISSPVPPVNTGGAGPSKPAPRPLRLLLHLSNPPNDKLMMSSSADICKTHWINQLREADFVKYRNTSRVTSLRKVDLDGGWDGLLQDDYELFHRLFSRLVPLPLPLPAGVANSAPASTPMSPASSSSRPGSTDPSGASGTPGSKAPDSMYAVRALPIKIYLPDGAPVIQDVIPPLLPDGRPNTVIKVLQTHLPLLFPPGAKEEDVYALATPLVQGVEAPKDAELAWLASCMSGADGWVRIGIRLAGE